jgi:hypothetical protein
VLIELVISASVAAYAAVVALGHVLLIAAIYKGLREDDTRGRGSPTPLRPPCPRCVMPFLGNPQARPLAASQEPYLRTRWEERAPPIAADESIAASDAIL